jgi:hypothetical protein
MYVQSMAPTEIGDRVKAVIEQVKAESNLEAVIERFSGQKIGAIERGKINCPFHSDKGSPSLHVYASKKRWRCFGACAEGGDVVDFVGKLLFPGMYNPHSWQHIKEIAERITGRAFTLAGDTGEALPTALAWAAPVVVEAMEEAGPEEDVEEKRERFALLMEEATARLTEKHRAMFRARGVSDEWIDRARLGWDGQRLTIPAFFDGDVWGIKRRVPLGVKTNPRYKYIFQDGSTPSLFNGDLLREPGDCVVITEDELSALCLCSSNDVRAVATSGAAGFWRSYRAKEWLRWFFHIPYLVFWRDADEVGKPLWQPGMVYSAGSEEQGLEADVVLRPSYIDRFYKCIRSGASGSQEPAWTNVLHAEVEDGSALWRVVANPGLTCAMDFRRLFARTVIVDSAKYGAKDASDFVAAGGQWRDVVEAGLRAAGWGKKRVA